MKLIPLSTTNKCKNYGKYVAMVSDEDFDRLSKYSYHVHYNKKAKTCYARRNEIIEGVQKKFYMHNDVFGEMANNMTADHANHEGLDNQRHNLRAATSVTQSYNQRLRKNSASKLKGVNHYKRTGKWRATISVDKKQMSLGYFDTSIEAARAYDKAAIKYHKEFAMLNFPSEHNRMGIVDNEPTLYRAVNIKRWNNPNKYGEIHNYIVDTIVSMIANYIGGDIILKVRGKKGFYLLQNTFKDYAGKEAEGVIIEKINFSGAIVGLELMERNSALNDTDEYDVFFLVSKFNLSEQQLVNNAEPSEKTYGAWIMQKSNIIPLQP